MSPCELTVALCYKVRVTASFYVKVGYGARPAYPPAKPQSTDV